MPSSTDAPLNGAATDDAAAELLPPPNPPRHSRAAGGTSPSYDPIDWYWVVGNHSGVVYSSKDAAYVPTTDTNYTNWTAVGNTATNILSDGELADVLAKAGLQ